MEPITSHKTASCSTRPHWSYCCVSPMYAYTPRSLRRAMKSPSGTGAGLHAARLQLYIAWRAVTRLTIVYIYIYRYIYIYMQRWMTVRTKIHTVDWQCSDHRRTQQLGCLPASKVDLAPSIGTRPLCVNLGRGGYRQRRRWSIDRSICAPLVIESAAHATMSRWWVYGAWM